MPLIPQAKDRRRLQGSSSMMNFNGKTTRNLRTASFTAGQLIAQILADLGQTELRDQLLHGSSDIRWVSRHSKNGTDVIFDRHLSEHTEAS